MLIIIISITLIIIFLNFVLEYIMKFKNNSYKTITNLQLKNITESHLKTIIVVIGE
jgi:hypothetical protein